MTTADPALFPGFEQRSLWVTEDVEIAVTSGGSGPPLLLLHGHPQNHVIWHRVAPELSRWFTLVMADLRGYGDSSKPPDGADHASYSKRVMAGDMPAHWRNTNAVWRCRGRLMGCVRTTAPRRRSI